MARVAEGLLELFKLCCKVGAEELQPKENKNKHSLQQNAWQEFVAYLAQLNPTAEIAHLKATVVDKFLVEKNNKSQNSLTSFMRIFLRLTNTTQTTQGEFHFIKTIAIYIVFYVQELLNNAKNSFSVLTKEDFVQILQTNFHYQGYDPRLQTMAECLDKITLTPTSASLHLSILGNGQFDVASISMHENLVSFGKITIYNLYIRLFFKTKIMLNPKDQHISAYQNVTDLLEDTRGSEYQINWALCCLRGLFWGERSFPTAVIGQMLKPTSVGSFLQFQDQQTGCILGHTLTVFRTDQTTSNANKSIASFILHSPTGAQEEVRETFDIYTDKDPYKKTKTQNLYCELIFSQGAYYVFINRCSVVSKNKNSSLQANEGPLLPYQDSFQIRKLRPIPHANKGGKNFFITKNDIYFQNFSGESFSRYLKSNDLTHSKMITHGFLVNQFSYALKTHNKNFPENIVYDIKNDNIIINKRKELLFINTEEQETSFYNPHLFFMYANERTKIILAQPNGPHLMTDYVLFLLEESEEFALKNSIFCLGVSVLESLGILFKDGDFLKLVHTFLNANIENKALHFAQPTYNKYMKKITQIANYVASRLPYAQYRWINTFMQKFFIPAFEGNIDTYQQATAILDRITAQGHLPRHVFRGY